ncbi:hypothetical protein [Paracoccus sulfuroxidans]|uniref:hypothetical protein n=1 Tax=Paracoccus sulfuroxidans TaxID=384678 RepID=UPI0011A00738|nr:hypothetical protein [Paracoccus sulfuroxidans]
MEIFDTLVEVRHALLRAEVEKASDLMAFAESLMAKEGVPSEEREPIGTKLKEICDLSSSAMEGLLEAQAVIREMRKILGYMQSYSDDGHQELSDITISARRAF